MLHRKTISALLLTSALALPVQAQSIEELKAQLEILSKRLEDLENKQEKQEKAAVKTAVVKKAEPAMALATDDGLFEFNVRGRIYTDAGWASDSDDSMDVNSTEFRAARIGVEGKAWSKVGYRIEADFAGNNVVVNDAFIAYPTGMGKVTVGHFKTPNSLEEMTSSRYTTFMERSSFTDAFNIGRRIGVMLSNSGDNWTFKVAGFRGGMSDGSDDEGTVFAARGTYGQNFDGGTWLLGASVRYNEASDGSSFRYRQRTHNHLADRLVDTGSLAEEDFMYTLESGLQVGSFHAMAEWSSLTAQDGGSQGRDATFTGGAIEAGWFLTGEEKPLSLNKGSWGRPKVNSPLHKGGMGAIQLAAKYDFIDLTDNGVFGGEQETIILGVNWYLNRHSRIMVNYSHSDIKEAFNVAANGDDGENSADTLGVRFQVDW